jgi:hypothetical protein
MRRAPFSDGIISAKDDARPKSSKELAEFAPYWDVGYDQTAYFLEWIGDVRFGRSSCPDILAIHQT